MRRLIHIKSFVVVLSIVAIGGAGGDCSPLPDGPCGDNLVPSVAIKITDELGEVLPFSNITYRLNQSPAVDFSCEGNCDEVVLAMDTIGRFDVSILAPGRQKLDRTIIVPLDDDDCHPETQKWIAVPMPDPTVGALRGAWRTLNVYGESVLRFGNNGEIIGAILYDRQAGGDGNFYVSYNGHEIRGVPGQTTQFSIGPDSTRTNDKFEFETTTFSFPVGFSNATMSNQFSTLVGSLTGVPVSYSRLKEIPEPLKDPE